MKAAIFYFFCMCLLFFKPCVIAKLFTNHEINDYLRMQSEAVHNIFLKTGKIDGEGVEIEEIASSGHIPTTYKSSFTLFNQTFILLDNKLHTILVSNGTITLNEIKEVPITKISFTKVMQFGELSFVLVKTEIEVNIYEFNGTDFFLIQSILALEASDAHFFTNRGFLYLIIAHNNGNSLAATNVYKWLGTYFDEIESILTTGAIKNGNRLLSNVYEFNFGRLKKLQHLKTTDPLHIEVQKSNGRTYVLILEKKKNLVYSWDGSKLLLTGKFSTGTTANESVILTINRKNIIIVPLKDKLQAFLLLPKEIKLVGEKVYSNKHYSIILDIYREPTTNITYIMGLDENNAPYITGMSIKANFSEKESHVTSKDILRNCFNTVEKTVYSRRGKLGKILSQINVKVSKKSTDDTDSVPNITDKNIIIEHEFHNLLKKINEIKPLLNTSGKNITLNGKITIKGSLEAKKLTGKNLDFKKINGADWVPQQWLKYKKPQNITGPVTINKITTRQLKTLDSDPLFTGLLTKNGDQNIWNTFNVINLTADEIITKKINDIDMQDIYLRSEPQPIRGLKIFENLKSGEAKVQSLNEKPANKILPLLNMNSSNQNYTFNNHLHVENLTVETIDNVHWNSFKNSVFRVGITNEINGNLTFPEFKTSKLTLKTLNNIKIEHLLTTSTEQNINSDIQVARIFAENIITNKTNDIKLWESAVNIENDTLIKGPVKFDKLFVRGNLELIGKIDKDFFIRNGDHIVGTNESDLWQNYEGLVTINGNLYLKNINFQPKTKMYVGNEEFNPDIASTYWTKNIKQSIPNHFVAKNGLNVPHLITNKVNDIAFNQYMLNKDREKFETTYHFSNITVLGDVFLDHRANHTPNLTKLNEEAVKTTGSFHINGKKSYTDTLRVDDLVAETLDGVIVNSLSTKTKIKGPGKKIFKNVIVKKNLSCNLQSIMLLNGVNIKDLLENAIYIDEPQNLEKLHFGNITVKDLHVTKINNQNIRQHILNVEKMLASDKINTLTINGNVRLKKVSGVSKINGIDFKQLFNKTLKTGKSGGILVNLEFLEHVKINNLITTYINDINLRTLSRRFLYRTLEQNITAMYSFNNIKTDNLVTSNINNISLKDLVDVSNTASQVIHVPDGLEFTSTVILQKSIRATKMIPCNLVATLKKMRNPPTQNWNAVKVIGNVNFLDQGSVLYRLFENVVTTNTKNVIQAPVKFSKHVMAENVVSEGLINGIKLQEIIDDAVLTDSDTEQIITGHKIFSTMRITNAAVMKNADVPVVNNLHIPGLDKAIVRKSDANNFVIQGKKTFLRGLQCDNFYSEKVLNIDVDNIVSTEKLKKIRSVTFNSIEVENNLNISHVNSFDFGKFLKNRLLTKGMDEQIVSGTYFFDNMQAENLETPSINKIKMENAVFDIDQQSIFAPKRFTQATDVIGSFNCEYINGINITDTFEKSVALEENVTFDGIVTIQRPSTVDGNINTEYINEYPVEHIKEILNQATIESETEKIHRMKNDIINKIKHNTNHIKFLANDYMYIEKTQALQISLPNTINARTMVSKDFVLIHVDGEDSGEYCGLEKNCICPVQYSIEISLQHSVNIFPNKDSQRIFSYDDDGMIIHFLTNSISTDSICRSHTAKVINEVSMMTWNTPPTQNTTGSFHQYDQFITGYISGVEFFSLNGQTYAIVGRYYDPTVDSYDLDSYLIKFSPDKSRADEIQKIPTSGAWSVYLFHTAQGVTLIIGNIRTSNSRHEVTHIYRFDENIEKFTPLTGVPSYGCSMATGVVLGTDSLIVLAHRFAPLQILKYDAYFDNYFPYQSFELDSPAVGISVFYTGGFGISDAYLCTVTENESFFIYSFRFIEGWKLESSGELEGLRNLIPFDLNKQSYLFAPSTNISSLLTVVKHGSV